MTTEEQQPPLEKTSDDKFRERFKDAFFKDLQYARDRHKIMNYHYLQYRGILHLNSVYGENYIKTIGLQINVPRTFMTVESIRPNLSNRQLNIEVFADGKKSYPFRDKARDMLRGEWRRSKSEYQKADAEHDALVFGTGYLLSQYVEDVQESDVFDGYDEEGKVKLTKGSFVRYKGMRVIRLNPYNVIRDHTATTNDPNQPGSWGHCYLYSLWDFDVWKAYCEAQGYDINGMEKGGHIEEFDSVRRTIDAIYSHASPKTRDDQGKIISRESTDESRQLDTENKIMVIERFEENHYSVISGKNWTINYRGPNPDPDKIIPIGVLRDYRIPGEFEGIGEPEVLRWQQYEENKIHNLSYYQVLMSTVQRYAVIEKYLVDPTEVRMSNPFMPIRLKDIKESNINNIIQTLNQGKGTNYPKDFLNEVKQIGQSATAMTDYFIGANESQVGTATEANKLEGATTSRISQKIYEMEERDLVPILEHWLACFPQYYDEELDMLIRDGEDFYVKFIPYPRDLNEDPSLVADYATQEGILGPEANTVENIFLMKGYKNVVFVSDIMGRFGIEMKTVGTEQERKELIEQLSVVSKIMREANVEEQALGRPPKYDVAKLVEEMLRQFPQIIKDPEEYIFKTPPVMPTVPSQMGGEMATSMVEATPTPTIQQ